MDYWHVPTTQWCNWSIKLLTGESNLEHFLTSLMGISSATLSFSLPLFLRKKMIFSSSFHGCLVLPMLCWLEKLLTWKGQLSKQNGPRDFEWNTSSRMVRLTFPHTWSRPPYTVFSGGVIWEENSLDMNSVWSSFACLASTVLRHRRC